MRGVPLTDEAKQAMQAAREAQLKERRRRKAAALRIGKWSVFQLDDDNWVIQATESDVESDYLYYPDIAWALRALLAMEISAFQRSTVRDVLQAIQDAEARILAAVTR